MPVRLPRPTSVLGEPTGSNPDDVMLTPELAGAGGDLRVGGRRLEDLLGDVLHPTVKGSGLPSQLRLTSYDPAAKAMRFHAAVTGQPFEATAPQVDRLMRDSLLVREGPPQSQNVPGLVQRLLSLLK